MTESDTPTTPQMPADAQSDAPTEPNTPSEATTAPAVAPAPVKLDASKPLWGVGRRKSSVARVRVLPGEGKIVVNKRNVEDYFHTPQDRNAVIAPLLATQTEKRVNVFVNVRGGGTTGQAGAIRMGLARALVAVDPQFETVLRNKGYLTRDSRVVERKKPGQRKARRRFQFSKR